MASSIIVGNVRQILGRGGFFDPLPPHPSVSSLKKTHPEQGHKVELFLDMIKRVCCENIYSGFSQSQIRK